jgi:hypothetical protein
MASSTTVCGSALKQELLTLFRRLNVASSPLHPYRDTSSQWFLDSGASFHMTPDSSQLSSLSSLNHPLVVQTADGTSLPVTGRGVLSTSSFHVPTVSHVPNLTMQLKSAGQITDHGCRIILELDSCCVQDIRTGLLVGIGPRCHDSQSLWELDWLRLPSSTVASPSSTSPAPVVVASATAPTFAHGIVALSISSVRGFPLLWAVVF